MKGDPPVTNKPIHPLPEAVDQETFNKWIKDNIMVTLEITKNKDPVPDFFGDMNGSTRLMDYLCKNKGMSFKMEYLEESGDYQCDFGGFKRQHKYPSAAICSAALASYGSDLQFA